MANKMNATWFYHDSTMRNDIKVKALRHKYGLEGYAVWCCLLEMLTDSEWFTMPFEGLNVELISADLDITSDRLLAIVKYCTSVGLFQMEGGNISCDALKRRFATLIELKEKRSRAGRAGMRSRWGNNNDITNGESVITKNNGEDRKGEEERGEEIKKETIKEKKPSTTRRFSKPSVDEVRAYCEERNNTVDAQHFVDYYESKGWVIGKSPMKDWKAAVRTWEQKRGGESRATTANGKPLGCGERIENGRRTYGDGRANIPMTAPARPSWQHVWDSENQVWVL